MPDACCLIPETMVIKMNKYEAVIGLEVHVQLSTKSKAFCGCSTEFGQAPNSSTCPVCLGFPGSLPVLNKEAFRYAIKVAIALNCEIQAKVKFDRKNYYYPDLPKNYQISQYDMPLAFNGYLDIGEDSKKRINIKRIHLEEDAGKLMHDPDKKISYVDYNRAGIPLLEIVSEPDIRTPDEAYEYLTTLKAILQYLEVSDCNMEEGSLRCDANVSIRKTQDKKLGTRVEIKNMNSFKAVSLALMTEIADQESKVEVNVPIVQETKLWDAERKETLVMRSKEEAEDYRYFPEPDLVPFIIDKREVYNIKAALPELPKQRKERIISSYKLGEKETGVIVSDRKIADYFEEAARIYNEPKAISNWITGVMMAELNERSTTIEKLGFSPKMLTELIQLINNSTISGKMAKGIFKESIEKKMSPKDIVESRNLKQISDEGELVNIIGEVINEHKKPVEDYKKGKANAFMFLVGQIMKKTKGKASPEAINKLLKKKLEG